MNRQINWNSGVFDEIELVYEKAEEKEAIGKLLEQLESQALSEAQANCGELSSVDGSHITSEQFVKLPMEAKEAAIKALAGIGLVSISQDMKSGVIFIRLSGKIQQAMACTFFDILNRLEKLDGAINMLIPEWTLELQVPLGGKKGLFQWEMLIMQLYPWISVRETSVNELASDAKHTMTEAANTDRKAGKDITSFYREMITKASFAETYKMAKSEVEDVIRKNLFELNVQGKPLSFEQWTSFGEFDKFQIVLAIGNHGISVDRCVCVDFAEVIPNCIAITLLYAVWSGQCEKHLIDAGDRTDPTKLAEALNRLYMCVPEMDFTIVNPLLIKIGQPEQNPKEAKKENEESEKAKKTYRRNRSGRGYSENKMEHFG